MIQKHIPLENYQHGFRQDRSTFNTLYELTVAITEDLNSVIPAKRPILVALGLSKAFGMVNRAILFQKYLTQPSKQLHVKPMSSYRRQI